MVLLQAQTTVDAALDYRYAGVGIHPAQYAPGAVVQAPVITQSRALVAQDRAHACCQVRLARRGVFDFVQRLREAAEVVNGTRPGITRKPGAIHKPMRGYGENRRGPR